MSALSLNRNFYYLGIFFIGLSILKGIFQHYVVFQLQDQVYKLQGLADWALLVTIIGLIASFMMLKYYYYKKYWFAFWTGLLSTIALLLHFSIFYHYLLTRLPNDFYLPSFLIYLFTGIAYGISLIFSRAGKRFWLKTAGIFLLMIGVILLSSTIWSIYTQDVQLHAILGDIHQWASRAGTLIPVLFIVNFLSELKALEPEGSTSTLQRSLNGFLALSAVIALVFILFYGHSINREMTDLSNKRKSLTQNEKWAAQPYEARTFVGRNGNKLPYLLLKPQNYDPSKKYPLVVHLHGGDGRGTDNVKQIYYGVFSHLLLNYGNRAKYPSFIFVPQCPKNATWGGAPYMPSMDALVFEAISALEEEFRIDKKRRYVMGASLGGYGTWHFIAARPEMFAAAVPVCGGGDPNLAPKMVDVPLWAFHGRQDDLVPVSGSRDMIEAIKKAGGNPIYTEYPDKGHDLWEALNGTPELMEWLFAQKRE